MASKWIGMKRILGTVVPISITVLAIGSGTARAQFPIEGSELLSEVMNEAIARSGASIVFSGSGTDRAIRNMRGLGSYLQGIAPLARSLEGQVLDFGPTSSANVIALDAGLVGVANIPGHCQNITAPLADPNNPAIAQIANDLSILLGGYSGSDSVKSKGTTAECAHPHRLQALAKLAACQGVNRIDHIYRLDEKSDVQDIFGPNLQLDYWCNGKSDGNVFLAGSNLANEDLDPIRRPCIGSDSTKAATRCTYYPLKDNCSAGSADYNHPTYGPIKCTQGLIVALSEKDPGQSSVSLSIANRVASDLNGFTVGLATLPLAKGLPGAPVMGTNINTVTYEDGNVRAGQYMFSRRMFLIRNPAGTGDSVRDAAETALFNWATNKCNLRQIVRDAGFLPPLETCSAACDDPLNITCLTYALGTVPLPQNLGAEGMIALSGYPCVADGIVPSSGSNCPVLPVLTSGYKCNLGAKCVSNVCNLDATLLSGSCQ